MVPHVGLGKLRWLLAVMGSIWADVFFFCNSLSININFNRQNGSLEMRLQYELLMNTDRERWLNFGTVNRRIYRIAEDWLSQSVVHDFRWDEMLFEVSTNSESTPPPMGISANA